MRKLFFTLAAFLFVGQAISHELADRIEQVLPSVAYISVDNYVDVDVFSLTNRSIKKFRQPSYPTTGSCFVIDGNKIVTNYHVIHNAVEKQTKIYVSFYGSPNVRYEADIVGYDKIVDVALLEIEGTHPSVQIKSNFDDVRMGESVFSISNYLTNKHSATQGIISSLDRRDDRFPFMRFLQLQILQGSGSSGGPTFDSDGKVIAINYIVHSMVPTQSQRVSVLSMSALTIRGDTLAKAIENIKRDGIVTHSDLGVWMEPYGPYSNDYLFDPVTKDHTGILIKGTDNDDFRYHDIILEVEGRVFTEPRKLYEWLATKKIGDRINIKVYRQGKIINIDTEIRTAKRR